MEDSEIEPTDSTPLVKGNDETEIVPVESKSESEKEVPAEKVEKSLLEQFKDKQKASVATKSKKTLLNLARFPFLMLFSIMFAFLFLVVLLPAVATVCVAVGTFLLILLLWTVCVGTCICGCFCGDSEKDSARDCVSMLLQGACTCIFFGTLIALPTVLIVLPTLAYWSGMLSWIDTYNMVQTGFAMPEVACSSGVAFGFWLTGHSLSRELAVLTPAQSLFDPRGVAYYYKDCVAEKFEHYCAWSLGGPAPPGFPLPFNPCTTIAFNTTWGRSGNFGTKVDDDKVEDIKAHAMPTQNASMTTKGRLLLHSSPRETGMSSPKAMQNTSADAHEATASLCQFRFQPFGFFWQDNIFVPGTYCIQYNITHLCYWTLSNMFPLSKWFGDTTCAKINETFIPRWGLPRLGGYSVEGNASLDNVVKMLHLKRMSRDAWEKEKKDEISYWKHALPDCIGAKTKQMYKTYGTVNLSITNLEYKDILGFEDDAKDSCMISISEVYFTAVWAFAAIWSVVTLLADELQMEFFSSRDSEFYKLSKKAEKERDELESLENSAKRVMLTAQDLKHAPQWKLILDNWRFRWFLLLFIPLVPSLVPPLYRICNGEPFWGLTWGPAVGIIARYVFTGIVVYSSTQVSLSLKCVELRVQQLTDMALHSLDADDMYEEYTTFKKSMGIIAKDGKVESFVGEKSAALEAGMKAGSQILIIAPKKHIATEGLQEDAGEIDDTQDWATKLSITLPEKREEFQKYKEKSLLTDDDLVKRDTKCTHTRKSLIEGYDVGDKVDFEKWTVKVAKRRSETLFPGEDYVVAWVPKADEGAVGDDKERKWSYLATGKAAQEYDKDGTNRKIDLAGKDVQHDANLIENVITWMAKRDTLRVAALYYKKQAEGMMVLQLLLLVGFTGTLITTTLMEDSGNAFFNSLTYEIICIVAILMCLFVIIIEECIRINDLFDSHNDLLIQCKQKYMTQHHSKISADKMLKMTGEIAKQVSMSTQMLLNYSHMIDTMIKKMDFTDLPITLLTFKVDSATRIRLIIGSLSVAVPPMISYAKKLVKTYAADLLNNVGISEEL